MWLSLNIISKMVDIKDLDPSDIMNRLTMSTAEIEGIEYMNRHLASVIAVKILDVKKHPDADKLTLVDCDTGSETIRVVCGAPNHKKGDIVPLAMVGTRFDEDFVIKKSKIRGEESSGMLCSAKELGFSDDHSGIMILPVSTPLGKPMSELFSDWYDVLLEIDNKSITHRPDLWCHAGFAREIAALFGKKFTHPVNMSLADSFTQKEELNVIIENPDASPRYCGLYIKNIRIEESPDWLKAAVTAIGMRPINNIVDITNYVMAELGEPMHAFDRKKLKGKAIIVRMAKEGEHLTTLDDQEHALTAEDIVIADGETAIALAGVMGGGDSEIDDSTTEIVLEAANFNPVSIRKTAGRYNLRTEAAIRFEKSLDPEICTHAIVRCYELVKMLIPEAEAVTKIVDTYPKKPEPVFVDTTTDFIRKKIGQDVPDERIISILDALQFTVKNSSGALHIAVPSYRATKDISIPDDIVEEVGRIHGYDNIPPMAPFVPCSPPDVNRKRLYERRIKNVLAGDCGMIEVSNYSFVGEDLLNRTGTNEDKELRLRNPLSMEQDRLRRSLVPSMLSNIALNQRYNESFRIFEMGRAYFKRDRKDPELASENYRVAGVIYEKNPGSPLFYEAKRTASVLLDQLRIKSVTMEPATADLPAYAHPGRCVIIKTGKTVLGLICELHPKVAKNFDIKGNAALFDIDMDICFSAETIDSAFRELPKFPDVPFEVSVLTESRFYAGDICRVIEKSSKEYIRSVNVISIYEGDPVPAGMKSVSVKAVFAAKDRTLSPEDIDKLQKGVVAALNKNGYSLR